MSVRASNAGRSQTASMRQSALQTGREPGNQVGTHPQDIVSRALRKPFQAAADESFHTERPTTSTVLFADA